jgi:propanol-preferring alcohol dehydrogenase
METLPDPEPEADEALIAVSACGVCRTDLHLVEGDIVPPAYPVVPGHEVVGTVTAVGSRVADIEPGDRVGVAWVGRFCERCPFCRDGRENLCESPTFTGFHRNGGYAERITAAAGYILPIPGALGRDEEVAPLLCAGIIGYRALKQGGLRPGRSLALYGFGGAAHIALQVAAAWDCEVFVISRTEDSRDRARALGADWVGAPGERMPHPVDHAVTFAPAGSVIPGAMENLRSGGTLSIAGIYLDRVPEMDYDRHLFRERSIVSTTANTRDDARELLALAGEFDIRTDIEVIPFAEANEALQRLKEDALAAQAAVLTMNNVAGL